MKFSKMFGRCCILFLLAGCGSNSELEPVDTTPLTVKQWTKLDIEQKYNMATLKRLSENKDEFAEKEDWEQFLVEKVVPQRTADLKRNN